MTTNGSRQSITFNTFSGQLNVVFASVTLEYIKYSPLQHQQAILAFAISALLNILQLKPHSPFDTHPKIMKMAVIFFLLYCFGCIVESRIPVGTTNPLARRLFPNSDGNVVQSCVRLFGYFSLVFLASILLYSDSVWPLLFLIFTLFMMGMLMHWLLVHCKLLDESPNSNLHDYNPRTSFFRVPLAVTSSHPV
ncbi:hypothetical protein POM88_005243 [Heracleum sosnowskyi]|uniref:Uncharacterized protein n=1 Tax=Heracleum sosnowskyi TaxID=360622 RepID=A0AAD8JKW8_9APIA|nr:hypothetical protein POM88_005243 [Heracleum sosnowskyi]